MTWAGHVARIGDIRNPYNILVGKPEGKRPLRRPRRRWNDILKLLFKEIGCKGVARIHLLRIGISGALL
jgi:hypothetical protein